MTWDEFNKIFAVNVFASFPFLREAEKGLADGGSAINLTNSSLYAYSESFSIYQNAKSVIRPMTRIDSEEDKKENHLQLHLPRSRGHFIPSPLGNERTTAFLNVQTVSKRK